MSKSTAKIVLAEDEELISTAYNIGLSHQGYEVIVARDGEEAIRLAKKELPDLLLLDLIMPLKNGFEVLRELKEDPVFKDLKVIVLTNLSQSNDAEKAIELGAMDFLIKSDMSLQQLTDHIKKALRKSRQLTA